MRDPAGYACQVWTHAGEWRLSLAGEIDLSNVPEVEAVLRLAQADATTVSVDLHEVSFIDSSGVAMLVRAQQRAESHDNEVVVIRPSAPVRELLAMCGMDRLLIAERDPDGEEPGRTHALIATDLEGVVTHWNGDAQALYGYAPEEVLGRPITNVTVGPSHDQDAHRIMETIRAKGRWQGPFEVVRADGSTFRAWVRNILVTDRDEQPLGVLGLSVPLLVPVPMKRTPMPD
jgi:anti-anti-sigma factor